MQEQNCFWNWYLDTSDIRSINIQKLLNNKIYASLIQIQNTKLVSDGVHQIQCPPKWELKFPKELNLLSFVFLIISRSNRGPFKALQAWHPFQVYNTTRFVGLCYSWRWIMHATFVLFHHCAISCGSFE